MKITELNYDLSKRRYEFTLEQNDVIFFRYMDRNIIEEPLLLKNWMNSLLEQSKHG